MSNKHFQQKQESWFVATLMWSSEHWYWIQILNRSITLLIMVVKQCSGYDY